MTVIVKSRPVLPGEPRALADELRAYAPQSLIDFGVSDRNIIDGGVATALVGTGARERRATIYGPGLRFGDSSAGTYHQVGIGAETSSSCTIVWCGVMLSGTTVAVRDHSSTGGFIPVWQSSAQFDLRWSSDDFTAAGAWAAATPACVVVTARGNAIKSFANGRLVISGTWSTPTGIVSAWDLHKNGNSAQGADGICNLFASFAQPLPDGLAREVSADPSRLFKALSRRIISLPSGGVTFSPAWARNSNSIIQPMAHA
jgi:hypothetical protein